MNSHSFCRSVLSSVVFDYKLKSSDFTITKSTIGGYEVQGPNKFYYNASRACCKWSAKAEAMEHYQERRTSVDLP